MWPLKQTTYLAMLPWAVDPPHTCPQLATRLSHLQAIAAECDLHTLGWCGALPESLYGHSLTAIAGEMVAYGGRRQGDDGIQLAPGDRAWLYNPGSMEGRWMALTTDLPLKVRWMGRMKR